MYFWSFCLTKNFKFIASEYTKIHHFEVKNYFSQTPPPVRGDTPPTPHPHRRLWRLSSTPWKNLTNQHCVPLSPRQIPGYTPMNAQRLFCRGLRWSAYADVTAMLLSLSAMNGFSDGNSGCFFISKPVRAWTLGFAVFCLRPAMLQLTWRATLFLLQLLFETLCHRKVVPPPWKALCNVFMSSVSRFLPHDARCAVIISAKWTKWMAEIMCSFDVCLSVCLRVRSGPVGVKC